MEEELSQEQPNAQNPQPLAGDQVKVKQRSESDVIVIHLNKTHVVMALVAVVFYFAGYLSHSFLVARPATASRQVQQNVNKSIGVQPEPIIVDVDDDPFLGSADAAVTIVEFSDYECPFCKRFRDQTLDQILETYEGKVRFVYRDFPLSNIHPASQKAAEAAECANEQGQFWPMHDQLFAGQVSWASAPNAIDVFKAYAAELALETSQFNECLETGKYAGEVLGDFEDGQFYGVTATPTFFINGVALTGALPFSSFQAIIDAELSD